jgi:hypothetical protein
MNAQNKTANRTYLKFALEYAFRESDKRLLAPWNNAMNEKITPLWKGYSTGQRTPSSENIG